MQKLINVKSSTSPMLLLLVLLFANNAFSLPATQELKEQAPTKQTKEKDVSVVVPEPAAADNGDVDNMATILVLPDEISGGAGGARAGECFQIGERCTVAEQCCTMRCLTFMGKCVS